MVGARVAGVFLSVFCYFRFLFSVLRKAQSARIIQIARMRQAWWGLAMIGRIGEFVPRFYFKLLKYVNA